MCLKRLTESKFVSVFFHSLPSHTWSRFLRGGDFFLLTTLTTPAFLSILKKNCK
ncbi:hypothetical protein DYD21_03880 [Rhodohalobacter sp. SW132]|nr:hypothetical protein DYD21_03880 [Rhodohalobacter sp. SW132]